MVKNKQLHQFDSRYPIFLSKTYTIFENIVICTITPTLFRIYLPDLGVKTRVENTSKQKAQIIIIPCFYHISTRKQNFLRTFYNFRVSQSFYPKSSSNFILPSTLLESPDYSPSQSPFYNRVGTTCYLPKVFLYSEFFLIISRLQPNIEPIKSQL